MEIPLVTCSISRLISRLLYHLTMQLSYFFWERNFSRIFLNFFLCKYFLVELNLKDYTRHTESVYCKSFESIKWPWQRLPCYESWQFDYDKLLVRLSTPWSPWSALRRFILYSHTINHFFSKKCPCSNFSLSVFSKFELIIDFKSKSPCSVQMQENWDQKKFRIRRLSTQISL